MIRASLLLLILQSLTAYPQENAQWFTGGTSIVAYTSDDSIWMAADSKSHVTSNAKNLPVTADLVSCKILFLKNSISGFAGNFLRDYNAKGQLIYDIRNEMEKALNRGNSLQNSFNIFSNNTIWDLSVAMKYFHDNFPHIFDSLLVANSLAQTVFTSFINKKSFSKKWEFKLIGNSFSWYVTADTVEEYNEHRLLTLGYYDEIFDYLLKNQGYITSPYPMKEKLNNLVQLEIDRHPDFVGSPVDIIVIYDRGYKWLQKKNKCD